MDNQIVFRIWKIASELSWFTNGHLQSHFYKRVISNDANEQIEGALESTQADDSIKHKIRSKSNGPFEAAEFAAIVKVFEELRRLRDKAIKGEDIQ